MGKLDKIPLEQSPSFSVELATIEDIPAIIKLQGENQIGD